MPQASRPSPFSSIQWEYGNSALTGLLQGLYGVKHIQCLASKIPVSTSPSLIRCGLNAGSALSFVFLSCSHPETHTQGTDITATPSPDACFGLAHCSCGCEAFLIGKPSKWREECPLVFSSNRRVLRGNGREHFQKDIPSSSHRGHGDIGSE